jgi:flagellar basal-body rod protein FlgB
MIESILNATTIPLLEKMAAFGERRQEVLAGNIANIDTPFYKMRDLPAADFQEALKDAVKHGLHAQAARGSETTSARERPRLDAIFPAKLFQAREAPSSNPTFHDANNRSIEQQVTEMTKNAMMLQFAVEVMSAQMNMLQMVVSERA